MIMFHVNLQGCIFFDFFCISIPEVPQIAANHLSSSCLPFALNFTRCSSSNRRWQCKNPMNSVDALTKFGAFNSSTNLINRSLEPHNNRPWTLKKIIKTHHLAFVFFVHPWESRSFSRIDGPNIPSWGHRIVSGFHPGFLGHTDQIRRAWWISSPATCSTARHFLVGGYNLFE